MHDIKWIRDNPDAFDAAMQKRGVEAHSAKILQADEKKRAIQTELGEKQQQRNTLAKQVGMLKGQGKHEEAESILAESKAVGEAVKAMEAELQGACPVTAILEVLPNIPADGVPQGVEEEDNVELRKEGEKPSFNFAPQQHFDLGEKLGQMDFETAARMSGSRFVVLRGALARLERALAQFMLDQHREAFGFEEVVPPLLVRDETMYGTGQLPKFSEDAYKTTEGHWLIPTSEVSLVSLVSGDILSDADLPMRVTAYTPCFRSEAGSAGRDTRGMIRQHQFSKVELVSIVVPEKSEAEHERMLAAAENILQKLGLHYRVLLLCTGDMGFGAVKTYDLEVWLPGQDAYREISSVSNCGAFQARRMKARFKRDGEKQTEFMHTLNGSGLAVGRTMVALLENYQQEDGSILIPEVLRPYMGNMEKIG